MEKEKSLQERFNELDNLASDLGKTAAQNRGREFENLVLDLFDKKNLLLKRSYHTSDNKSQEIDGAIEFQSRIFLIETKWTDTNLAASSLYSFIGKIESKFAGTSGVFISRNELSPNFLNSLRSGRRQNVLVIHGDDIPKLFQEKFPLNEYLKESLRKVSIDNHAFLSVEDFLLNQQESSNTESGKSDRLIKELLKDLDQDLALENIPPLTESKDAQKLEQEITSLIKLYPKLLLKRSSSSPLIRNVSKYISSGSEELPHNLTRADELILGKRLKTKLENPNYHEMIESFSQRLEFLPIEIKQETSSSLVDAWKETSGIFEKENKLVDPTRFLWPNLSKEGKKYLMDKFIDIVNDSTHQPGFPQYRLARNILYDQENVELRNKVIKHRIEEEYNKLRQSEPDPDSRETKDWAWKWTYKVFKDLRKLDASIERIFENEKVKIFTDDDDG